MKMNDEWMEKKLESYKENFKNYVDYVEVDYIYFSDEPFESDQEVKSLTELEKGSLFVTDGDEAPWLQVMIAPGFSFALKPELLSYWCEKAEWFYRKKNNSLSETVKKEGNE